MALYRTIQSSFTSGLLNPMMQGAVSTTAYASGLSMAENCYYGAGGGIYKRPGTRYQCDALQGSVIHPFLVSGEAMAVEFADKKVRLLRLSRYGQNTIAQIVSEVTSPWSSEHLAELSVCSQSNALYVVHRKYPPYRIEMDNGALKTPEAIAFVSAQNPQSPQEGDFRTTAVTFSGEGDYPSLQAFVGGRWFLMATENQPNAIWFSRTYDASTESFRYNDFTLSQDVYVIDPSTGSGRWEPLDLADLGGIYVSADMYGTSLRWVISHQTLLVATGRSIYSGNATIVTSSTDSPLSLSPSLSYGSASIGAVSLGNYVFFVGADKCSIRCIAYSQQYDSYTGTDIMQPVAQYLSSGIKRLAVTDGPTPHLWVLSNSGELLCCQFEPASGIVAWSRFTFHGSDRPQWIEGIQGGEDGSTCLLLIMDRSGTRTIESLEEVPASEVWKRPALDCYRSLDTGGTVEGPARILWRSEGQKSEDMYMFHDLKQGESMETDSKMPPEKTVELLKGYGYEMAIATLRSELPANGTSQGAMRAIVHVTLRLSESSGGMICIMPSIQAGLRTLPKLSDLADSGSVIWYRIYGSDKYGSAMPLFTGDMHTQLTSKSTFDDRIAIVSAEPYPFAICAVIVEHSPKEA